MTRTKELPSSTNSLHTRTVLPPRTTGKEDHQSGHEHSKQALERANKAVPVVAGSSSQVRKVNGDAIKVSIQEGAGNLVLTDRARRSVWAVKKVQPPGKTRIMKRVGQEQSTMKRTNLCQDLVVHSGKKPAGRRFPATGTNTNITNKGSRLTRFSHSIGWSGSARGRRTSRQQLPRSWAGMIFLAACLAG